MSELRKAYRQFKGVWQGGNILLVSTTRNPVFPEGKYSFFVYDTSKDLHEILDGTVAWELVCTKEEFDELDERIHREAPRGATHVLMEEEHDEYFRDGSPYLELSKKWSELKVNVETFDKMIPLKQGLRREKWYLWKGEGEPPKDFTGVLLRAGEIVTHESTSWHMTYWEWQHGPEGYEFGDIIAYTKGELV